MVDTRPAKRSLGGIQGEVDQLPRGIPVPVSKSVLGFRNSFQREAIKLKSFSSGPSLRSIRSLPFQILPTGPLQSPE